MEFRSAALVGAGAIGGFFIKGLSEALGSSFCLVASGERADRLRKNGLVINGEQVYFNVCSPQEAAGADLILVATKYNSLPGILEDVRYMTGPGTTVVSTLNGVDSEEILAEVIGQEHILNAFMIVASRRVENRVDYNLDAQGLIFGEKDTPEKTPRAQALDDLLTKAGISHRFTSKILTEQWQKYVTNIGNRDENYAGRVIPEARFSTLQDLDAGRRTEIEMFAGILMKKAAEAGIEVPYVTYTYHAIRALEEKNEGLIR